MSDTFIDDPLDDHGTPAPAIESTGNDASYLESLNEAQREAVETLDGPVLLLAGAGTGKTRALTTRLAHILTLGKAQPWEILAVTFTNKAAREMRLRVDALVDADTNGLWLGTFHAMGARLLRRNAKLVGLESDFTIIDADDQIRLIKQIIEDGSSAVTPRTAAHAIEGWKNDGLAPSAVSPEDKNEQQLLDLYNAYQDRLLDLNAADFGDLLLHCIDLLRNNLDVLATYQNRFRYILVDEYQDTNTAQYLLLRLLAQGRNNICCVGDDDQSIYGWRGAEIANILNFEKHFPEAKIIRLERNYRSTEQILAAAAAVIDNNNQRLGKTLWTEDNAGQPIEIHTHRDGVAEARAVGDKIRDLQENSVLLQEIAILVRASFQTRAFEDYFLQVNIPYRIVGGRRFFEREEIRDAIAYLRVVHRPGDDLAFERICNRPPRGIGAATIQTLHSIARNGGHSLHEAARLAVDGAGGLGARARENVSAFCEIIETWRQAVEENEEHIAPIARKIIDESGLPAMWDARKNKDPTALSRVENLGEFVSGTSPFPSLQMFLDHVSLVLDNDAAAGEQVVNLMTLHAAKGLEFDAVFLPGWEEGLFPHSRSMNSDGEIEEERRLAYVGITRARKHVIISCAASRMIHGSFTNPTPSRFISEMRESDVGIVGSFAKVARLTAHEDGTVGLRPLTADAWKTPRRTRPGFKTATDENGGTDRDGGNDMPADGLCVGARCSHRSFGMGTIIELAGKQATVVFDTAGKKKLLTSFIEAR